MPPTRFWVSRRAGKKVTPPSMGSDDYPVLGDAPGTYVLKTQG